MTKHAFDQDAFARRLAREIDGKPLTARQQARLASARMAALSHAQVHAHAGLLAGMGNWLQQHLLDAQHMRRTAAFVLLFGIAVAAWWQMQPDTTSDDEVDAMLLADELPPDAYLSDQIDRLTQGS